MKVYVIACAEKKPDFLSRKIMHYLKCGWSHCMILVEHAGFEDAIYHCVEKGVCEELAAPMLKGHIFVHKIDVTAYLKDYASAMGWLDGAKEIEYSFSAYVGFMFPRLRFALSRGRGKMVCSEFVVRFMNECTTFEGFKKLDADYVDPKITIETLLRDMPQQ